MRLAWGGLCPVTALALLAACASLPPGTPGPYDGTYAGSTRLVGFSSPDWQCDWQAPQLTVRDSRFSADIDGAPMTVAIAPDGTFDHYAARPIYAETKYLTPVHIFGRIVDGTMDATVRQPRCTFKLTLGRQ
ncbi:MAG: hypothetical protein JOY66_23685 [Acetobacteraceae bacterium]|nr:hypothetical protein [Acetobacteraceae bacterium]